MREISRGVEGMMLGMAEKPFSVRFLGTPQKMVCIHIMVHKRLPV
jgi:hypothetical protein